MKEVMKKIECGLKKKLKVAGIKVNNFFTMSVGSIIGKSRPKLKFCQKRRNNPQQS
jgi:hypothetical protein